MTRLARRTGAVRRQTRSRPDGDAPPGLSWAIDTAATPGRWGDLWGDTHFANSLAAALRRRGQRVVIDRRDTRGRASRAEDHVVVTLRGLEEVAPTPGAVNLLWVISHPDEVSAAEAAGYDAVFAASPRWAAERSAQWGVPVEPLLQCTDRNLFGPDRTFTEPEPVVFIGNARRGATRPVVDWAVQAGADVRLYGTGWEDTPHAARVVARSVPNAEVGAHYAGAGIVLNDHWADMRRTGFLSNRLFDAVASGARVLSDPVEGMDLFEGCVVTCDSAGQVGDLLSADPDLVWPSAARRREVAERIRAGHSFDARAAVLLQRALSLAGAG